MILLKKWIFKNYLSDGEKLFEVFHHHSIAIWGRIFAWIILGILLPIVFIISADILGFSYSWWWASAWITLSTSWIIYHVVDWYFDALIVTNYSLLHVKWNGFFDRMISRIEYEDIKEVEIETNGILESVLQFGTIKIHTTAGGMLEIFHIHHPKKVDEALRNYRYLYEKYQRYTDKNELEMMLHEMIKKHVWEYGSQHGFLPRR